MSRQLKVLPADEYNDTLVANVHPTDWQNPMPAGRYNLVVIGAGTAGLVTAAGAAGLGARVALIERHLIGGDCLNVGCVPSKCLIRSARVIGELSRAPALGVRVGEGVEVDFGAVMERMRRLRAHISAHDAAERFRKLGVDVFLGEACFTGPDTIDVGGTTLRFKKAVIATGARAVSPSIPGIDEAGFLTNETVFSLTERPRRLAVIGGGPIGCELAQTFQRLGSQVVLFHRHGHVLNKEDPQAAEIVQNALIRDGIELVLDAELLHVRRSGEGKEIQFKRDDEKKSVVVDEILVGVGRAPNVAGLGLESVRVEYDERRGVRVDDMLRTTNPRIYAAGDVCMAHKFTHAADAAARIVIQNALFLGRKKLSRLTIPRTTYTDPEIAAVGLGDAQAEAQGIPIDTYTRSFADVDRAIADGDEEGFVKVHVRKDTDRIVGATIVARHAGEMLNEITLAMVHGIGLKGLGGVIHPYPTQAEAIRHVADAYSRTRLTPSVQRWFARWLRWTR